MEIRGISQGGQIHLDSSINNESTINTKNNNNEEENKYSKEAIKKSVDKLNKLLEEEKTYAVYEAHEVFGDIMIKIINEDTKEVIMECPPKKVVDLVAKMCEMAGVLVDKKA